MKLTRLLFLIIICVSCSSNKDQSKKESNSVDSVISIESRQIEVDQKLSSHNAEVLIEHKEVESFNDFLVKFKSDPEFQISRTDFPFNIITVDIVDNVNVKGVQKSDWELIDLNYDSSYYYREFDKYQLFIETAQDSSRILFRGFDNGILCTYIFYNRSNKWVLNRLEDFST